jgi:MEMO1 family protein
MKTLIPFIVAVCFTGAAVATGNHWSLEQFPGYTSRDKAGLGWEGWKNADIYIYEAKVLEENKK